MEQELNKLYGEFSDELNKIRTMQEVEALRVKYLGKKGRMTQILHGMSKLRPEERPVMGQLVNSTREKLTTDLKDLTTKITQAEQNERLSAEKIDVTRPGRPTVIGSRHPLTQVIDEICSCFIGLGFSIAEGPEIEYDLNNFELLRIPKDHPARDEQDTFYITPSILLRTQTSPVQIRVMQEQKPPLKIVCPGRVYRSDTPDATHTPIFHQVEGLVVDEGVTMADLIGSLELFARTLFGQDTKIRLRPHHFPFTEPSCEVDLTCWNCGGSGCGTCKGEGWIEVLGAGMVHPEVLENCAIDSSRYTGFAFGIGVERTAMGRFGIQDIRTFYENDLRFLRQFS